MNPFEEELRKALRRQEAPDGFSERLFARIGNEGRERASFRVEKHGRWVSALTGWQWAVAFLVMILGCGGVLYHEQARVERGEAAKKQLLLAMRITHQQLHMAEVRVRQMEKFEKEMQ